MTPRVRDTARALWRIYVAMTVAQIALLLLVGLPLFDSITVTFGTMSTGGFAPWNASISAYQSAAVDWIVIVFMTLAGANFGLYYLLWRGRARRVLQDTETQVYLLILAGISFLVAIDLMLTGRYRASWMR